ncbi:hypothetical protein LINPERHAP1_LOCUS27045 [Linum perenne]
MLLELSGNLPTK